MLLRRLGRGALQPAGSPLLPGAACASRALADRLARQVHGGAAASHPTAHDALSSGKAPSSHAPDMSNTGGDDPSAEPAARFNKEADLYLGGLWEKLSAGLLRGAGGEGSDVQLGHEGMRVKLPQGGRIDITKDPEGRSLVVRSNLHDTYGSDGTQDEVPFRLQAGHEFEVGGETLAEFLEDGLAKHLKLQVDLQPDPQTVYGPDPT